MIDRSIPNGNGGQLKRNGPNGIRLRADGDVSSILMCLLNEVCDWSFEMGRGKWENMVRSHGRCVLWCRLDFVMGRSFYGVGIPPFWFMGMWSNYEIRQEQSFSAETDKCARMNACKSDILT